MQLTLPHKTFITSKNIQYRIIDIPGLEDSFWQKCLISFIEENKSSLLPVLLVDLTQGTTDLEHFSFLKKLSREIKCLRVTVVFTKFMNSLNDLKVKLLESNEDLNEMPDDEYYEVLLGTLSEQSLSTLKEGILKTFPNVDFFIFDPSATDFYFNGEDVKHESQLLEDARGYACIGTPIQAITESIEHLIESGISEHQRRFKVTKLYERCEETFNEKLLGASNAHKMVEIR